MQDANNVSFQKISIPTPWMVTRNSEGSWGALKWQKFFKKRMKLNWKFQKRWGVSNQNPHKNHPWERHRFFLEQHNTHKDCCLVRRGRGL